MSPKKIETLANFKLEAFSFPCGIYQVQPIRHIQITILLHYFGLLNTDRFLSFINAYVPFLCSISADVPQYSVLGTSSLFFHLLKWTHRASAPTFARPRLR